MLLYPLFPLQSHTCSYPVYPDPFLSPLSFLLNTSHHKFYTIPKFSLLPNKASPNKSHTSLLHDTAGRGTSLSQLGGCLIKDNKLIVLLWWSKERFVQCAPLGYKGFSAFHIGPHQVPVFNLPSFQSDNLTPTFLSKGVSSIPSFHYVAARFDKTYKIIFEIWISLLNLKPLEEGSKVWSHMPHFLGNEEQNFSDFPSLLPSPLHFLPYLSLTNSHCQ